MSEIGWIKLHRKILDNPIFLKPDLYQLFSYCLLRANHSEKKIIWNSKEEILEKGCFITGRKVIAGATGQSESAVYRKLKVLEKLNMITLKSNNKYSVVKVLNYSVYQGEENESEQPLNNQRTTTEQPVNTDKNVKNEKNEKNDIYKGNQFNPPTTEEVRAYCEERNNSVDATKWHDFYSSKGWMVGKNKMKDWKAAVRTWERNNQRGGQSPKPKQPNRPKGFDAIDQWAAMTEGMDENE